MCCEQERDYQEGLEAESKGRAFSMPEKPQRGKKRAAEREEEDRKKLAISMMKTKDRRLYNQMQYGIERKKKATDTLVQKKRALQVREHSSSPMPCCLTTLCRLIATDAATCASRALLHHMLPLSV